MSFLLSHLTKENHLFLLLSVPSTWYMQLLNKVSVDNHYELID